MKNKPYAEQSFYAIWKHLTDLEGHNITIPVAVQKEMIESIEARLDDLRTEIAQELLDMEVR